MPTALFLNNFNPRITHKLNEALYAHYLTIYYYVLILDLIDIGAFVPEGETCLSPYFIDRNKLLWPTIHEKLT